MEQGLEKLPDRIFRVKMTNSKKSTSKRTSKSQSKANVLSERDAEIEELKSEIEKLKAIIDSNIQAIKSNENKAEESNVENSNKRKEEDF